MRVRAAESERADRRAARVAVAGLPGGRGVGEEERAVAQAELRVLLGDGRLRRQRPVVQRERGLDEPRDPSRGHRVSDVRLDGSERGVRAVARRPALLAEQLGERADLDHVAHRRRGAVRLDEADGLGRKAGVLVGQTQRLELAGLPRRHRAFAPAVVVARRAADQRVDPIAIALGILAPLEDHGTHALAHHEPVGPGVEGTAFARSRDGADAREADEVVGQEVEVDAAGDGHVDLSGAKIGHRLVRGDESRGAGRVDRERRAAQIELLRDDRRGHVEQVAGHAERAQRRDVLHERLERARRGGIGSSPVLAVEHLQHAQAAEMHLLVLADRCAHEHARAAPGEFLPLPSRVLQGTADHVEQQPVLRVGHLDAARCDAEVQCAEFTHLFVIQIRAARDVCFVGSAQRRVEEDAGMVPARCRNVAEDDRAIPDQVPVGQRVGRLRKPAAQSDDRDVQQALPPGLKPPRA